MLFYLNNIKIRNNSYAFCNVHHWKISNNLTWKTFYHLSLQRTIEWHFYDFKQNEFQIYGVADSSRCNSKWATLQIYKQLHMLIIIVPVFDLKHKLYAVARIYRFITEDVFFLYCIAKVFIPLSWILKEQQLTWLWVW